VRACSLYALADDNALRGNAYVSFWPIAASDVCDGTSVAGESRRRTGYRLRLERDPHRMRGLFDVDEVTQIEHNLLMPMHAQLDNRG
jgi:hypothetical protein